MTVKAQKEEKKGEPKKEDILLSFLRKTKDGKYAEIEQSSLTYSRITEDIIFIQPFDEEFYYSVS